MLAGDVARTFAGNAVVGGVNDDGVIGNAEFVESAEHGADLVVEHDHTGIDAGNRAFGLEAGGAEAVEHG
jgi:hypothetical protein